MITPVQTSTRSDPDRPARLSADPSSFGFTRIGWAVTAPGGYVQDWNILQPNAGVVITPFERNAVLWKGHRNVGWMARKVGGQVAEVWESDTERLICWGDHIPPNRRIDDDPLTSRLQGAGRENVDGAR